jgi:hypothetical protein
MEDTSTKNLCYGPANAKGIGNYLCDNLEFIIDYSGPDLIGVEISSTPDSYYIEDLLIDKIYIPKKSYLMATQIGTFYKKLPSFEQLCYKKAWDLRHEFVALNKPFLFTELYKKLNFDIVGQYYNIEAYKKFSGEFNSWNNIHELTPEKYIKFLYYHLFQLFGPNVKMSDTNWFPTFVNMAGNRLLWLMHIACPRLAELFYECIYTATPVYLKNYTTFCWIIVNNWLVNARMLKQTLKNNKMLSCEILINGKLSDGGHKSELYKILYTTDSNFVVYLAS